MPWLWPLSASTSFFGQQVHDEAGEPQREHRGQQHQERQQRAAVDEEQDQRDHRARDEQQQPVDTAERLDEVGDLRGRAR